MEDKKLLNYGVGAGSAILTMLALFLLSREKPEEDERQQTVET